METRFDTIDYLHSGNSRQREAYGILTGHLVFEKLQAFSPVLAGTIPINIDIDSSDLDIICCFTDKEAFIQTITDHFKQEKNFALRERAGDPAAVIAAFRLDGFEIELFGQNIPVKQQLAYRHMLVEHALLQKHGEALRQQIIALKRQGHKTEPAFAIALGLAGDPYTELLTFETT